MLDEEGTDSKTDWRQPYDPEFEEWVAELRAERRDYPNLRADLRPIDPDDEPHGES